jgi:hypothetical protein
MFSSLAAIASGCGEPSEPTIDVGELVVASEGLTLGSIEDGPEAFGRITGLIEDSSGRIYVADYQAGEVRVFAPEGQHLFSFGGKGAGPGELSGPCCMAWAPDGTLWIRDGENQRYSGFEVEDTQAVFISSLPMAHTDGNYFAPVTFTVGGGLIDVGHRRGANGEQELVRFILDSSGQATEAGTLTRAPVEALGGFTITSAAQPGVRYFFYQPFSTRELVTHGPQERWAYAISSSYEITVREGDSSQQFRRTAARPRLSSDERESAVRRMEADAARAGISVNQLPYEVPESKPPLQAIFFDEKGRLWAELSQTDGMPRIAEVWDSNGTMTRRVQWPGDIALGWIGEHSALGIRRDSLGVEHVVRLTF